LPKLLVEVTELKSKVVALEGAVASLLSHNKVLEGLVSRLCEPHVAHHLPTTQPPPPVEPVAEEVEDVHMQSHEQKDETNNDEEDTKMIAECDGPEPDWEAVDAMAKDLAREVRGKAGRSWAELLQLSKAGKIHKNVIMLAHGYLHLSPENLSTAKGATCSKGHPRSSTTTQVEATRHFYGEGRSEKVKSSSKAWRDSGWSQWSWR